MNKFDFKAYFNHRTNIAFFFLLILNVFHLKQLILCTLYPLQFLFIQQEKIITSI